MIKNIFIILLILLLTTQVYATRISAPEGEPTEVDGIYLITVPHHQTMEFNWSNMELGDWFYVTVRGCVISTNVSTNRILVSTVAGFCEFEEEKPTIVKDIPK